ncbi:hypothetical protein [Rhizobium sp. LC145]|uniref:hypothetical protein n=1 Tax=Rhizobium sp. LC145 TaxID=1120688 RepID=UPI00062A299A|nr:hypothetical protein [Rhizobium sp. LC145]KKX25294.1 hypothetical protein YH62_25430 [Rhizobium sp. LC145]TKT45315.1 hypothetical protein FDR95_25590 [Rhizobiaceae bacterium LC148]
MVNKSTKKGSKVYVCATAQNEDLTQTEYEALTWVQVGKVGNVGDFGADSTTNSYNTLDAPVTQKQKGTANAGDPQIEVASIFDDPGQIILRSFGDPLNQNNMAIKIERNDKPSADFSNTTFYSRGVVSGPLYPGGGSDDFELERFTIGLNQLPIRVNPADTTP